jgi:hypothetical protein
LSGFLYDRPSGRVIAKPRMNAGNFTSFWSAGAGWGVFTNSVRDGRMRFTLSAGAGATSATAGKRTLAHEAKRSGDEVVVTLAEEVHVTESDPLVLIV